MTRNSPLCESVLLVKKNRRNFNLQTTFFSFCLVDHNLWLFLGFRNKWIGIYWKETRLQENIPISLITENDKSQKFLLKNVKYYDPLLSTGRMMGFD